jgi:formylglycine-generating enzyme required for sulfatase activity
LGYTHYSESDINHPTPVGIFPESCSPDGVIDMAGNVWEWCEDWYGGYPSGKVTDPPGPSRGSNRVNRGGNWGNFAVNCRLANCNRNAPDYRNDYLGFRLRS